LRAIFCISGKWRLEAGNYTGVLYISIYVSSSLRPNICPHNENTIKDVTQRGFIVMPVSVEWKNEDQTILGYTLDGRWNWTELYRATEHGLSLNNNFHKNVYVTVDLRTSLGLPSGGVTQLTRLAEIPRPNTRMVLIVGGGSLTASLVSIYKRIRFTSSTVVKWVPSMEDALLQIANFQSGQQQITV
jgi:hypothetical protein